MAQQAGGTGTQLCETQPGKTQHGSQLEAAAGFSVLMAVYAGDRLDYLRRAVLSSTVEQTCVPTQLVIVRDGPVPEAVQSFLDRLAIWLDERFAQAERYEAVPEITVLELAKNSGPGACVESGPAAVPIRSGRPRGQR
jgi:hypothetical protein